MNMFGTARRGCSRALLGTFAGAVLLLQAGGTAVAQDESSGWMSDGNAVYITLGAGLFDLTNDPARARYASVKDQQPLQWQNEHMERAGNNASLELGAFFVKAVSMGLRYEYHSAEYYFPSSGWFGPTRSVLYKTRIDEVLVDLRAWMPPRRGVLVGLAGGWGKGKLDGDFDRWSNTGGVYQFYAGAHFAPGEGNTWLVVMRAGYSLRNYGTTEDPNFHPNEPIELDMSGWFFELGVGGIAKIRNDEELE